MGKQDISNRTLATLLVVAIVISLGGTYLVMQNAPSLTGLAFQNFENDTGTFSFENVGFLAINLDDDTTNFDALTHVSQGICSVVTDTNGDTFGCTSNVTDGIAGQTMLLNNTGNVDANISVNVTNAATALAGLLGTRGRLAVAVATGEGGCNNLTGQDNPDLGIYKDLFADDGDVESVVLLCENFTYKATEDAITITCRTSNHCKQ